MGSEVLKRVGLNKYQSEVLYNLIRLKEAKASEIAKVTDISRVRVYDIFKELYSMGIIKKIEGRPTRYVALSPEKTFEKILLWKKQNFDEEKNRILESKKIITKELEDIFKRKDKEKPKNILELISLGKVSEIETKKIIQESKKNVKIMSEALEYIDSIEGALNKTNSKIQVILQTEDNIDISARKSQKKAVKKLKQIGAEIRYFERMPLRGCIVDNEKAILNIKDKKATNLLRDCILTNHSSFVEAMNLYFDNIWEKSHR